MRLFRIVKLYKNVNDKDHEVQRKKQEKLKEIQDKIEKKIQLTSTIKRTNSNSNNINNSNIMGYTHQSASLTNSVSLVASKRRRTLEIPKEPSSILSIENSEPPELSVLKESRVGKKLSEMTTKRVICLVLLLLLSIPLFDAEYYFDEDQSYIFGQKIVISVFNQGNNTKAIDCYNDFKARHEGQTHPLVYASFPPLNITFESPEHQELRNDEKDINIFIDEKNQIEYKAAISLSKVILYLKPCCNFT